MAKSAARAKVKSMPLKKAAPKVSAKKATPRKPAPVKAVASRGPTAAEKQRFTLYGFATSGPTYTAALMLSLCKHPFSYMHVNLREGAHKQAEYLVKNRFAQVPALRDGQMVAVQSAAILMHLSSVLEKFEGKTPLEKQRVTEWLFWAWDKLAVPVFRLRARSRGTRQFGDEVRIMYDTEARAAISVLENELAKAEWIGAKKPSIADVAVYGVLRYAGEGGIDLLNYPHVSAWKKRFEELPGFATPEQLLPMESRLI
ncbi:MAG: glutathione S-transferase family protein [Alphaproteobacteria bacterium]|nr:glutathione S-transferase family protein [Alphaproteobacteria bacterium]